MNITSTQFTHFINGNFEDVILNYIAFFIAAVPFFLAGCAKQAMDHGGNDSNMTPEADTQANMQQELRQVFESNVEKVPLFYRSNQSFDPDYATPPESVEELLGDFERTARNATGTGSIGNGRQVPAVLVDGEPSINREKQALIYNIIWDTESPICSAGGQCRETAEEIKDFAVIYTRKLTASELVCKRALTWRYLAYGATAVYFHHDAQGEIFYAQKIDLENCPRNKDEFSS